MKCHTRNMWVLFWARTSLGTNILVQKDAARVVTGAIARCCTVLLIKDVAWAPLQSRRQSHRLTLFYKIVNGLSPPYLCELLPTRVADRMRYTLRTSQDFRMPICRTNSFKSSFLPNTVMEWNGLDQDIRNETSLSRFKNKCRVHRERANSFYSLDTHTHTHTHTQRERERERERETHTHIHTRTHTQTHTHAHVLIKVFCSVAIMSSDLLSCQMFRLLNAHH